MASIDIEIWQADKVIERRSCRLYRIPDGNVGALVDGVVFALRPGPIVDLAAPWHYQADCSLILDAPPDLSRLISDSHERWWSLEQSDYYRYLHIDLVQASLDRAAAALAKNGCAVSRHGEAFATATDGRQYRSFIRLEPTDTPLEVEQARIALLLRPFDGQACTQIASDEGSNAPRVSDLLVRVRDAEQLLARAEENLALRRIATAQALDAADAQKGNLIAELGFVRAALTAQRERLATMEMSLGRMQAEIPAIEAADVEAVSRLQTDLTTAMDEWAKAAEAIESERRDREVFAARNAELEAELRRLLAVATTSEPPLRPSRSGRIREDLSAVVGALMPRLRLVRGSLDFLANEVPDWKPILGVLSQLQHEPGMVKSKRVQSSGKWLERHFSTGRADIGRVYWCAREQGLDVLVSDKAAQQRDFAWMKLQ